jgi:hypothetical protein
MPRKRTYLEDPDIVLSRQLQVLKHRMCWPPLKPEQIARKLGVSTKVIERDMEHIKTKFNSDYFAKTNHARVARATAEMEVIAFMLLADAEKLSLKAYPAERANFMGKAMQALQERNRMMLESGMITKAATKLEMTGKDGKSLEIDVTATTVQQRIEAITAARAVSLAPASG